MTGRTLLVLAALTGWAGASFAQGYSPGGPPSGRRAAVGYNCEAVQVGVTGTAPFSCPLAAPGRLGARCFCNQPVAAFSGGGPPLAGQVVP